ncbi:hypothetical protein ABIE67_009736 [Streptomyces sp. V4I8]|uniref:methyltransferase n=1 Tax=Streptomyces sp. V4I8 TaxID=3156469 RepID=UPI003515766B
MRHADIPDKEELLSPAPLLEIADGFRVSRLLAVCIEMKLFTWLKDSQGVTTSDVSKRFGVSQYSADAILSACASIGLLKKDASKYRNSELAQKFLVEGQEFYFGDYIAYVDKGEYLNWVKLKMALYSRDPARKNFTERGELFSPENKLKVDYFWKAMHSLSVFTAAALSKSFDFSKYQSVLDLGGAPGSFSLALCKTFPQLRATVFDLPFACDITRNALNQQDTTGRISVRAGDFLSNSPLPSGFDSILLSNILHDWEDPTCIELLGRCYAALENKGCIVIAEAFIDDGRGGPQSAALMNLNMLIETYGRNRSVKEYASWLLDSGFTKIEHVKFSVKAAGANGAIIGYKI